MNKLIQNILFKSVLVIILLHIGIPHPHADELTTEEHLKLHKNSKSLLGYLKFAFHEIEDDNLDNLICLESNKTISIDKIITPFIFNNSIKFKIEFYKKTIEQKLKNAPKLNNILFNKINGLRAPPCV